ncbi:MAG TPA: N-acetylglucosamine-6-phosphate deacetylase, partial [Paracoccaceae bacterium]|nr:N-acetylglucosamine-6-phosphate deacetylase [Paracoccaceae bacterium]
MNGQVFTGAAIFDGERLHENAALVVEGGRVAAVLPASEAPAGERIALQGGLLAPGFIDLQVNGGGGVMLNDRPDLEGIRTICEAHGRLGSTGLLPTLITDRPDVARAVIAAGIAAAEAGVPGFLGLHLEGPHLDPRRKGAHDPALIRPMTAEDLA